MYALQHVILRGKWDVVQNIENHHRIDLAKIAAAHVPPCKLGTARPHGPRQRMVGASHIMGHQFDAAHKRSLWRGWPTCGPVSALGQVTRCKQPCSEQALATANVENARRPTQQASCQQVRKRGVATELATRKMPGIGSATLVRRCRQAHQALDERRSSLTLGGYALAQ